MHDTAVLQSHKTVQRMAADPGRKIGPQPIRDTHVRCHVPRRDSRKSQQPIARRRSREGREREIKDQVTIAVKIVLNYCLINFLLFLLP